MDEPIYQLMADTQAITAVLSDIKDIISNINTLVTFAVVVGAAAVVVYIIIRPIIKYFW